MAILQVQQRQQTKRPRDFQKSKVYKWEATLSDFYREISAEEANDLVRSVWGIYKPRAKGIPVLSFGRNGKVAWATDKRVHIPGKTRIAGIAIHEAVHSILYDDISVTHCPIFLCYLIDAFGKFEVGEVSNNRKSALDMKLNVAPEEILQVPIANRDKVIKKYADYLLLSSKIV